MVLTDNDDKASHTQTQNPQTKRRIGLVIDHPLRDLDGICLVAQLLTERGHEAILLPFYTQHFDLPNVALDLIVLNYARPANRALVQAAAARGIALAVLDTEGGLIPDEGPTSAKGIAAFLRSSGLDSQLAFYLFWGDHLRDHIAANTALADERAIVTGCPRFDLAQPRYKQQSELSKRVLINTNFPVVNSAHTDGSEVDADALRSVGFSDREIADLAETVRTVMQRMIEAIRALAAARPAKSFVIRPHPFERADPYESAFADLPNVSIERVGTAMEALSASECLLHVNCTTAIEACLCAVPPISLDYINEPKLVSMARLPSQISHSADSLEEALALIDGSGDLSAGVSHKLIAPFFGALDGEAATRVANTLAQAPLDPASSSSHLSTPLPLRARVSARIGAAIGSTFIEGLRRRIKPSRAIKSFTADDVRSRTERFAAIHGKTPAKTDQIRSQLGLPTQALRLSPQSNSPHLKDDLNACRNA